MARRLPRARTQARAEARARPLPPTPPPSHRGEVVRVAALAAAALAIALRAPVLLRDPRLWAEEGSVYFSDACARGVSALFAPHLGYYAIVPNVASQIARLVPMERAALVMTLVAFAVQLVPCALVLWGRSSLVASPLRRAAALAVVVFTLQSGEVWLNTITSQFHLSLAAILVMTEPAEGNSPRRRGVMRAVLAVAGLSGPPTAILAPVFAAVAWRERTRERWIQAGIVGACAVLQVALSVAAAASGTGPPRFAAPDLPLLVLASAVKIVVIPVTGQSGGVAATEWLERTGGPGEPAFVLAGWITLVLGGAAFWLLGRTHPNGLRLAASAALVGLVSGAFSTGTGFSQGSAALLVPAMGERYYYAPAVAFVLLLLGATEGGGDAALPRRIVFALLCAASLCVGVRDFDRSIRPFTDHGFPRWADEVAAWRADPRHAPRAWPPWFVVTGAR